MECSIFADQRNLGNDKSNNARRGEQSAEEDSDKKHLTFRVCFPGYYSATLLSGIQSTLLFPSTSVFEHQV